MNTADPFQMLQQLWAFLMGFWLLMVFVTLIFIGLWIAGIVHCSLKLKEGPEKNQWVLITALIPGFGAIAYFIWLMLRPKQNKPG